MLGPVTYQIELENGRRRKCHQDYLRERVVTDGGSEMSAVMSDESLGFDTTSSGVAIAQGTSSESQSSSPATVPTQSQQCNDSVTSSTPSQSVETETANRRYPRRHRKPRQWYEPGTN